MKKIICTLLIVTLSITMLACGNRTENDPDASGTKESGTTEKQKIVVALSVDTIDESNQGIVDGTYLYVDKVNASDLPYEIEFTVYNANGELTKQLSDIETILAKGCDILCISGVDTKGIIPAFQQASDAGVIIVDSRNVDFEDCIYLAGNDLDLEAETFSVWLKKYLEENPDYVVKAGLIYGNAAQTDGLKRCDILKKMAEEMPDRIQILDERYGDWDVQKSMEIMENWLLAQPEMNFVLAANDIMARGASNAIVAANRRADFKICGYDCSTDGLAMIKEDVADLTVGTFREKQGASWVQVGVETYLGNFKEDSYSIIPTAVTKENVDEFIKEREEYVANYQIEPLQ